MTGPYGRPEPLGVGHVFAGFDCGDSALNQWLVERAMDNQRRGASRTYVATRAGRVVGYYCLAAAAVPRADATGRARRNMPEPIPAMLLGRLAVDRDEQGTGLGRHLVRDAVVRTLRAADIAGVRVLLVHVATESAVDFYLRLGFEPSPTDPMHLMLTLDDARRSMEARRPKRRR